MPDLWNTLANTAKSLGGAAVAPAGAVLDLAQMTFDDEDDDFGSVVHALSARASDAMDPIFNPQTITGAAVGRTLAGLNWAYTNGVSEPVATANMVNRHAFGGYGNFGPMGWLAAEEQMARRGWQKYGELTGALTVQAQQMGLNSYMESPELLALKRAGVEAIRSENYAFDRDYGTFDSTQFDRYLDDMRTIVDDPVLAADTERTDIQTLKTYLALRDYFDQVFQYREAQGWGGVDAAGQVEVRRIYTAFVGQLVESNTYFETNMFNGLVERDPWLIDAAATAEASGV